MNDLRLLLLGSPRLECAGRALEMDTRKALALFAFLALSGQEQQRDRLVTLLYPDADPTGGRAAFRRTLSTLHAALGEGILSIRRDAVSLVPGANLWVDVHEFKKLAQKTDDLTCLEQAVELYQDEFMAGFSLRDSAGFDEWQYQQSEELRSLLDRVLARLAELYAARGSYAAAIRAAERRLRLDPLAETSHRLLMELHARGGQRSAALQQYRECVRILEEELGVSPLEETTALYQQILNSRLGGGHAPPALPAAALPSIQPLRPAALVGREREMMRLRQVLEQAPLGPLVLSIEGEAGVGKTRLAEEMITLARQSGRAVAQARCYQGESTLAYTPYQDCFAPLLADEITAQKLASLPTAILAEINRLFPGVQPANTPLPDAGPGAHARFFEALRQMAGCLLGGSAPGMLFLDDLQWADSGTLDLLTFLARRMRTIGCILLLSWRSEQSAVGERLTQLIDELQRSNEALRISLNRLSPQEIARLALSHGTHLPARWCEQLYQESEGLPFIALEYLNAMDPSQPDWQLPGGVRALLHTRLQAPGETARQLLTAAAVIGRSFDFATLQVVSGRSEWETITGLEELLQLGLIRERGSSLYDFSHDKLRAVAYEESSTARRRLLHLRAGEAMASGTHAGHENTAWAGLAANHYLQAGQTARAAELYRQAGDQARRLYANSEALSAYQSALAAGHPDVAGLREACGDLFTLMGNYREAVASYQSAAAFCAADCLSSLMHKLGEVYQRRGEWAAAEGHYQAALDAAGADGSPIWLAHLFADWSLTLYRQNQIGPAKELADRSFGQAQAAADPGALAQALNMLGILARSTGDLESARQYFEHSLEWANRLEDASMRCAALNNLARLLQEQGCPREAIPLARQALLLCAHLGDRHRQAAIQNNLADLYHQAGQEKEAMAELKQAVALFAGISEEAWQDYPEIWKMTEW